MNTDPLKAFYVYFDRGFTRSLYWATSVMTEDDMRQCCGKDRTVHAVTRAYDVEAAGLL